MASQGLNALPDGAAKRLCLLVMFALCALSAVAQGGQPSGIKNIKPSSGDIRFEVVSIHPLKEMPNRWSFVPSPDGFNSGVTTSELVKIAYAPEPPRIALLGSGGISKVVNLPKWANDGYSLNARVTEADLTAWQNQGNEDILFKTALRNLLTDRFQLAVHEEKTEIVVYHLVVAKNGPKLKLSALSSEPAHDPTKGMKLASGGTMANNPRNDGRTEWHFTYATMEDLAEFLGQLEFPVENKTNLTGRYDFVLLGPDRESWDHDNPMNNWPIDQLGLEVNGGKAEGINIVVDHIERPSEN